MYLLLHHMNFYQNGIQSVVYLMSEFKLRQWRCDCGYFFL